MEIKVFGQLVDVFGAENISTGTIENVEALKADLEKRFPALAEKTFVVAVNRQIVHENISLGDKEEIALLPPFSGG
ncbi:MAG: MoaD/ThiS family protein [Ginsengibacter sp.]|nr:MoaD/ThiS family protein [Hanamia sp.]